MAGEVKLNKRHKRWRQKSSEGLVDCLACETGDHQECEDNPRIFCGCWREKHDVEIFD